MAKAKQVFAAGPGVIKIAPAVDPTVGFVTLNVSHHFRTGSGTNLSLRFHSYLLRLITEEQAGIANFDPLYTI